MSQTKEKIKIFSKFRPFVHSGEIDVHSNFVCSLYSDSNKRLRGILENKQLYVPNFTTFNDAREGWFNAIYKQGISIKEVLDNMYERKLEKIYVVLVRNLMILRKKVNIEITSCLCGHIMQIVI